MLSQRFEDALVFAAKAHQKQKRKGSDVPYVSHLMGVCSLVLEHGGTEDEAIAALLHDAVEDQGGAKMLETIGRHYGRTVADIVSGCSEEQGHLKSSWILRKQRYIQNLHTASPSVKLVSCADKVHNVRHILSDMSSLGESVLHRFTKGPVGTVWYYRALSDAFALCQPPPPLGLIGELDRCVDDIERMTGISGRGVDAGTL